MRLALLCDDPEVVPWLDAIASESSHEVLLAVALAGTAPEPLRSRSGLRWTSRWEDLIGGTPVDAVVVGGATAPVLDAIKQVAAAGRTLVFLPHVSQGLTYIYELSLIRDENHVTLHPACWHRCDPALVRARQAIRSGSLGKVQLLQLQRELPGTGTSSLVPQAEIDAAMLLDFDLLRWLSGDYDQVTALRTGASDQGVLTQSVKLAGRGLPEATWDARAGSTGACRVTITATNGTAILERDPASQEWVLTEPGGERHAGDRQAGIREFLRRIGADSAPMEWHELIRAFETVDATHRSVNRRRTIELHFEPMSERAMFKSQMTAIGCSVLVGTFLLVLVYLAIASTVPLPPMALLVLRTLVFVPLGVFLIMQVLYPLTRPTETDG